MTRLSLPQSITQRRLVIVARRLSRGKLEQLSALVPRVRDIVFEITMDSSTAAADISWLRDLGATVGAGTITNREEAQLALDSGAEFLVAPYLDDALVEWAVDKGTPIAPGALTPTEIVRAWSLGAAAVKIFPASVAGPQLIRELRGPLGYIPLMPTGGINGDNALAFVDAGAVAVGVGGWLTSADGSDLRDRWQQLNGAVTPQA